MLFFRAGYFSKNLGNFSKTFCVCKETDRNFIIFSLKKIKKPFGMLFSSAAVSIKKEDICSKFPFFAWEAKKE